MAKTKKVVKKKAAPKAAAKPAAVKPIKEALSKSGLVAHIAEAAAVAAKDVRAVLAALEGAVAASVSKKGAGSFTLPGLLKISAVSVPAKPKRKGINPFTKEEQWFAAKPATVKVKVRPLKKLKDAAA
ncbi:HU family DNA-binding protein [Arenimonas oryziterrae]|uniref:Viral histone-like protein n=1 Tax=Arenimonas oryziterrae DSM 21050 = YC6267 TaxID=1121015 RepID=A0A091ATQ7_9GAMM|nr:HU family DNA-binding protein [Arenimonas oryziterrae]KFN42547.1 DNA-binding protein [Arenimonas oryziterrae DSM 21050 = YC6267]